LIIKKATIMNKNLKLIIKLIFKINYRGFDY